LQGKIIFFEFSILFRFALNAGEFGEHGLKLIEENPDANMNKSYEYSYGDRQDFEIAVIPIHTRNSNVWYGGEHWMIGFYLRKSNELKFYDPQKKPLTHWHRIILHHLIRYLLPDQQWQNRTNKGKIVNPIEDFNGQPINDGN